MQKNTSLFSLSFLIMTFVQSSYANFSHKNTEYNTDRLTAHTVKFIDGWLEINDHRIILKKNGTQIGFRCNGFNCEKVICETLENKEKTLRLKLYENNNKKTKSILINPTELTNQGIEKCLTGIVYLNKKNKN